MTSLIISSPDKKKREEYIQKYLQSLKIDKFDITTIQKNTAVKQNTNTIGIEEIKNMQKKLFLKPIKSPAKAIILEDAHLLTTQAQNALLKVLEEPPRNTIIILSSESKESLIPTIISRCRIIEIEHNKNELSAQEIKELTLFIENLPKMTISEKFKKAEELAKDKEKTLHWTEKLILAIRDKLILCHSEQPKEVGESHSKRLQSQNYVSQIKSFQKLHALIKTTNSHPRFLLETTLLSITD